MVFDKLTNREQVLIFIVAATFIGGGYGLFRYAPELKKLSELQAAVTVNKDKVKNPVFPEEPEDDVEDLKETAEELEAELADLKVNLENAQKNLAPVDSQEMILKISEAARAAGVRVIENVAVIQKKNGAAGQASKPKLTKRQQRKADREAKKKNRAAGGAAPATPSSVAIPKEGELMYRLVNEFDTPRPFQRISVEGSFADLQKFIQSLRALTWQATLIKLDIDVAIQTPMQGVPQPITARMLVAR